VRSKHKVPATSQSLTNPISIETTQVAFPVAMSTFLDQVSSETCASSSSSIATPSDQSESAAAGVDDEQQEADLAEFATLAGEFGMSTVGVDVEVSNTEFVKVVKPAKFAHFHCRSSIAFLCSERHVLCIACRIALPTIQNWDVSTQMC
jgi:hypothetical protein